MNWTGNHSTFESVRFTLKQPSTGVSIQFMNQETSPATAYFYDADGGLVGLLDITGSREALVTRTFTAPAGKLFSRIDVKSDNHFWYTRFEFQV